MMSFGFKGLMNVLLTPIVLFCFFVNSAIVWSIKALSSSPSMMNTLSLLLLFPVN